MLTGLFLKNFKTWEDTGIIFLKPVTMLLGTNSSGKSTLIQSLLLLKQTIQSPDRSIHLNLGGDEMNDFFNFGSFDDILNKSSKDRFFLISLEFTLSNTVEMFSAAYIKNIYGLVEAFDICINDTKNQLSIQRRAKGAYSLELNKKLIGTSPDFAPERSIALPAAALAALGEHAGKVEDMSLAIRRELEAISYLGPLRRKPERDYVWNRKVGTMDMDGHNAVQILLSDKKIVEQVSHWLNRMGVAEKLEVRRVARSNRYEIVLHREGVKANLRDVGIGVSQVLPVLTLAFFAPTGSTILLEEPEIHLHPLAQSVLAELFVEVSKERNVQFIVETHSEHLFRRMQTLMARGTASTDDCAMYFIEKGEKGAEIRELKIDEFGRLTNWPDKFFGDALGETREQARLMFERQKAAALSK